MTLPTIGLFAMAVTQSQNETREEETRIEMLAIVREIADSLAHKPEQITDSHTERDDIEGFRVSNPVTPGIVYAKRGVSSDGWGYVWNRIHVTVASSSIGTNSIMEIKNNHNLEVVDVWQSHSDRERDLGQHDEPAINFALEPRE